MTKRILSLLAAGMILVFCKGTSAEMEENERMNPEGWINRNLVFYEIFISSFSDADGDGIGDLRGLISRMDYLNDGNPLSEDSLGIEGIWLTPVFSSPSYHKYDVTDYYSIDSAFGTEDDLRDLIRACHQRKVKLILDLPLNHTGRDHIWFQNFLAAHRNNETDSPWYDFYTWMNKDASLPSGRRFMTVDDIWVEANFSDEMPELNFDLPAVREEVLNIGRYYLEMGVDGFRFDAAKYLYLEEPEKNIAFWRWYMDELRKIQPAVYTVAEVWDSDSTVFPYFSSVNCFRFETSQAEGLIAKTAKGGNVNRLTRDTEKYWNTLREINPDAIHIPFLSNHDMDRAAGYLPEKGGKMAMAVNLYLLTPGSPFMYYGEEIGLRGSRGGSTTDANRRLHMPWGDGDTVMDPPGADYESQTKETVQSQQQKPDSLFRHYQKVLRTRKENPEITSGIYTALNWEDIKMGGFLCTWKGSTVAVIHNTSGDSLTADLSEVTDIPLHIIASVLGTRDEGFAELSGTQLTLGGMTSIVLRTEEP